MGITIHFQGRLRSRRDLDLLVEDAKASAEKLGWPHRPIGGNRADLARGRDDENRDCACPTTGVEILPHDRSDPLRLEFDSDLRVEEFIKTQFAGPQVHCQVIELLRRLEPHFEILSVDDEGDFWSTGDKGALEEQFSVHDQLLADYLRENPDAEGPIRLPSGRWADAIS